MFTGIIEELGRVRSLERRGEGVRMTVEARVVTEGTGEGDSVAVNGVCLTALEVRRELVRRQREMGEAGTGCVLDGRDIGTVVFPEADVKFFLTAAPEARARRRLEEERARDAARDFEATLADINDRDLRDATRADSPLAIADDAVVIDTTELSAEEVFQTMLRTVQSRQAGGDPTG
jgi:cytidylate kinase